MYIMFENKMLMFKVTPTPYALDRKATTIQKYFSQTNYKILNKKLEIAYFYFIPSVLA